MWILANFSLSSYENLADYWLTTCVVMINSKLKADGMKSYLQSIWQYSFFFNFSCRKLFSDGIRVLPLPSPLHQISFY